MLSGQLFLSALQAISQSNSSLVHSHTGDTPFPGLPVTSAPASASYWAAHNHASRNHLIGYGKNDELPSHSDVVIIGAGISGATVAHFLIKSDNTYDSVVMLEAREVSSGATGRNGGFIKPVPFRTYGDYRALHGVREALHIIQSEYDALELTAELVESIGVDVGFTVRSHREIVLDKASADNDRKLLEMIRADRELLGLPHIDAVEWFNDAEEARLVTRSRTAIEAYAYKCGSIWPHKFVHALINNLLSLGKRLSLYTNTPATSISRAGDSMWMVRTPRGNILTRKVIVTTNGFTSTLLPSFFMGHIVPKRSQMAAYTPPASFGEPLDFTFNIRGIYNESTTASLGTHHSWLKGFEEAYGLTTSDGTLVMGGELAHRASDNDGVQWLGSIDDTNVFERTTEYYRKMPHVNLDGWDAEGVGEGLFRTWTGIQGHTVDTLPFVGAIPGEENEGLFVSAGFHGHGMARCVVASRGVIHQLLSPTGEWDPRIPQSFRITSRRLNASYGSELEALWELRN